MSRLLPRLVALTLLAACTPAPGPTPTPTPSATPHNTDAADATACARLGGDATALTAAKDTDATAVEVQLNRRYDVDLSAMAGGSGGVVTFYAPREAEWSVYLTEDVPVMVRDASGFPMTLLERYTSSTHCAEVRSHSVLLLDPGAVTIELGPTEAKRVGLVIEATHP
jgi:hypothetical protein